MVPRGEVMIRDVFYAHEISFPFCYSYLGAAEKYLIM
jgi:hypothetical protein